MLKDKQNTHNPVKILDKYNVLNPIEILDKHNLTGMLSECWIKGITDPYNIKEYIQGKAVPSKYELYAALDLLPSEEFMSYLIKRYDIDFMEVSKYYMLKPWFVNR